MSNNVKDLIVNADIEVHASVGQVWKALVDRESLRQFMMGADVISDWKEGSPIVWRGIVNGVNYEDKGTVLKLIPEHMVHYSHYSKLSGKPDLPENYHSVAITLSDRGEYTLVSLSQTNNASEAELRHNEWGWKMILGYLKKFLEK
ncbi:MAG: SRPBCC domain-containing protein [Thaumarchaeota archaeon]|nr:SRPBCC domain-containing protein [Nitrososphaerota archaeon]